MSYGRCADTSASAGGVLRCECAWRERGPGPPTLAKTRAPTLVGRHRYLWCWWRWSTRSREYVDTITIRSYFHALTAFLMDLETASALRHGRQNRDRRQANTATVRRNLGRRRHGGEIRGQSHPSGLQVTTATAVTTTQMTTWGASTQQGAGHTAHRGREQRCVVLVSRARRDHRQRAVSESDATSPHGWIHTDT
jgi:hypothetical protein